MSAELSLDPAKNVHRFPLWATPTVDDDHRYATSEVDRGRGQRQVRAVKKNYSIITFVFVCPVARRGPLALLTAPGRCETEIKHG